MKTQPAMYEWQQVDEHKIIRKIYATSEFNIHRRCTPIISFSYGIRI